MERARQGKHRFIVRLGANGSSFPVWDKSLRRVRRRYPRAVDIWRVTEDRPPWLGPRLAQAGRLVRQGAAATWRWARNRDAKPW